MKATHSVEVLWLCFFCITVVAAIQASYFSDSSNWKSWISAIWIKQCNFFSHVIFLAFENQIVIKEKVPEWQQIQPLTLVKLGQSSVCCRVIHYLFSPQSDTKFPCQLPALQSKKKRKHINTSFSQYLNPEVLFAAEPWPNATKTFYTST